MFMHGGRPFQIRSIGHPLICPSLFPRLADPWYTRGRGGVSVASGGETSVAYGCGTTFTSERGVVERGNALQT